jgi:ubiquinone/menaquinone biosynthesis C-methylase UbiE
MNSNDQTPVCVCCGKAGLRPKWHKNDYDFIRCPSCELIYIDPLPSEEDINKYYEEEFFDSSGESGYQDYEREQRWRARNYRRDIEALEKVTSPGRLLDVGCAMGHFMDALPDSWDPYGLEVSHYAGEVAQKRYGDRVQIAALKDGQYEAESFDVVTLWETLNHMIDPFGDLKRISRVLKPGGVLVLSVGDVASLLARVMGKFWYHVTPPIHLYYFTPRTLEVMFEQAGLETVRFTYPGKYVDIGCAFERISDMVGRPAFKRICRGLASGPWIGWTLYLNLRDTMYVYARKKEAGSED